MHALVVGGGLSGLACALQLSRNGCRVELFERSSHLGGRARSPLQGGAALNLGPHALYKVGAVRLLKELGIRVPGRVAPTSGWLTLGGEAHPFGDVPWRLLATPLLPGATPASIAHFFARLALGAPEARGRTVQAWLGTWPAEVARLVSWLVRLTSYANAPDVQCAERAAAQVLRGLRGVIYPDGGWERIVESLRDAALAAGVTIHPGAHVEAATESSVTLAGQGRLDADLVVLAVPPAAARSLGATLPELVPARVMCLDLLLARAPARPQAYGLDEPHYFSVQGPASGGVAAYAARYLAPGEEPDPSTLERWLTATVPDLEVVARRSGVHVATHAVDLAGVPRHGLRSPEGHWLVGDWVGEGMLADAGLASAMEVARLAGRRQAA